MKRKLLILGGALLWACGCGLVLAAQPDREALRACAAEQDDAVRLACYDRQLRDMPPPPPAVAAERPASTNERPGVEEKFGTRGGEMARKQSREDEKVEIKELTARVMSLTQRPRGERVFTLDNGQVWVEKRRASYLPVKEGDTVTITAAALGAFRLNAASGRSTQVQRVQ